METQALAPQHIHIHQHPFPFNKQNKSKAAGDDLGQNDDDTAAPRRQELHTPLKTERKGEYLILTTPADSSASSVNTEKQTLTVQ